MYALAAVTYEMLAGEPPFTGPTVQAIVARLMSEAPRVLFPVNGYKHARIGNSMAWHRVIIGFS